jgi:hypothetical protein
MNLPSLVFHTVVQTAVIAVVTRFGRFRRWPSSQLVIDAPLALAEERTSRLRRIHTNAGRDAWDGARVFRDAMERHGGVQLERDRREALARVLNILLWGELAAWSVAAELAEGLEDPDARMAASSQAFDEARHFYVLRDYMAALHVPFPPLDPFFTAGARRVLRSDDLVLKLVAIQLLAEGGATAIFRMLMEHEVEPVLCDILPLVEKDEARHVGLGVMHLPQLLGAMRPREWKRVRRMAIGVGNLIGAANFRNADAYRAIGIDPRTMARETDKVVSELIRKLGSPPGSEEPYFPTVDVSTPAYQRNLEIMFPEPGQEPHWAMRAVQGAFRAGERVLPA